MSEPTLRYYEKHFFNPVSGFLSYSVSGQIKTPAPSPSATVEQQVGLTNFTVSYSRPGMKGRTIFGDLVPYGEIWRTGANANTTISFDTKVTINGKDLEKGTYAIYTVPKKDSWDIIFYQDSNNWGVPQNWDESKVVLKTGADLDTLPFEVETFTIMFGDLKNDSAVLSFIWGSTAASLKMNVPTDEMAVSSIERVMNGPSAADYFAAASYYHDVKKDLDKAYEWIKKAVELGDPNAFWVLRRKALIEADLGMKKEAIATARKSLDIAEKAGNKDYVKMNKESLEEWGAK